MKHHQETHRGLVQPYIALNIWALLFHVMACYLISSKPFEEPTMALKSNGDEPSAGTINAECIARKTFSKFHLDQWFCIIFRLTTSHKISQHFKF